MQRPAHSLVRLVEEARYEDDNINVFRLEIVESDSLFGPADARLLVLDPEHEVCNAAIGESQRRRGEWTELPFLRRSDRWGDAGPVDWLREAVRAPTVPRDAGTVVMLHAPGAPEPAFVVTFTRLEREQLAVAWPTLGRPAVL